MLHFDKYPQYQLYEFTLLLNQYKDCFIEKTSESRSVYSTIINRAYYASYLCSKEYVEDKKIKIKIPSEFNDSDHFETEHEQVIKGLKEVSLYSTSYKLYELKRLRHNADYEPYKEIKKQDVEKSIMLMKEVINKVFVSNENV